MKKIISPFYIIIFISLLAICTYVLKIPEHICLILLTSFLTIIAFINPGNGISFLLIIAPFYLGNSKRPFFWTIDLFVIIIIISALIHIFIKRNYKLNSLIGQFILLFLFASIISLPLNLKDLYFDIKGTSFLNTFNIFFSSHEGYNHYYLRILFNLLSASCIFFISKIFIINENDIKKIIQSTIIVYSIILIFGYLYIFHILPHPYNTNYLSLSLIGIQPYSANQEGMTAFAYNAGYLGQYLSCFFPFISYYIMNKKNKLLFINTIILCLLSFIAIIFTYQRGPLISIFSQIIIFSIFYIITSKNILKSSFITLISIVTFILLYLIFDYLFIESSGISKITLLIKKTSTRTNVWKVAFTMFKENPIFGVGLGKFHYFFPYYCKLAGIAWSGPIMFTRTTAHNIYLHILAEQGIIGLLSFLFLIFFVFYITFKNFLQCESNKQKLIIILITSLTGFLTYSISQYMFYLRSIQLLFFINLSFISILLKNIKTKKTFFFTKKTFSFLCICYLILFFARFIEILKFNGV